MQAEMYSDISQLERFVTRELILLGDPSHKLGSWTPIIQFLRRFSPINGILSRYLPITISKLDKRSEIVKHIYRTVFLFYNNFPKNTSLTFNFEGEIVEGNHSNQPNSNSPVPVINEL